MIKRDLGAVLEMAIDIAIAAHQGQRDKGGQVYSLHPLRLMLQMDRMEHKIIAVLHDVVEDSNYTFEDLLEAGIPEDIVDTLRALTKQEGESYELFIQRVKENELAIPVKIADMKDNSDLSRIQNPTNTDHARVEKYQRAIEKLEGSR